MNSGNDGALCIFDRARILKLSGFVDLQVCDPKTLQCLTRERLPTFHEGRNPEVSVVIPVFNKLGYTYNCLQSLSKACLEYNSKCEVIVVDDASTDQTRALLSQVHGLKIESMKKNMGFVKSSNFGVRKTKGQYVVLLNNDTIVTSGWLTHLIKTFKGDDRVGAVGSKLVYPSGILQEAGSIVWNDGSGWNYGRFDNPAKSEYEYVRYVDYCSAASLAVRREFVRKLGIFDERFSPGYYEDTDLCMFVWSSGGRVLFQPESVAIHFEGVSHGRDVSSGIKKFQTLNRRKFVDKWKWMLRKQYAADSRNVLRARDRLGAKSILVIDRRMPEHDTNSGDLRMYSVLQLLRSMLWNVTYFPANCVVNEPYATDLRRRGIEVARQPFREFLSQRRGYYDVVLLSRINVAERYIDMVHLLSPESAVIVDFPDLESVRMSRYAKLVGDKGKALESERVWLKELELARKADLVLAITEIEQNQLIKRDRELRVKVLPNVHEIGSKGLSFDERRGLLFVGGFEHQPNVDAVQFLVNEILPLVRRHLPDIELIIAGSKMPLAIRSLQLDRVRVLGYVQDLTHLLRSCRVFVAPLRYGAGLKGKVGMAMASGLPVVTSSIGAEGIRADTGRLMLVEDDPKEFAKCVVQLYTNRRLWAILQRNARAYAKRSYSHEVVRQDLSEILEMAHPIGSPRRREELAKLRSELDAIKASFGYKVVRFCGSIVFCPEGTRRGEFKKLTMVSLGVLIDQGLRSCIRQASMKIRQCISK